MTQSSIFLQIIFYAEKGKTGGRQHYLLFKVRISKVFFFSACSIQYEIGRKKIVEVRKPSSFPINAYEYFKSQRPYVSKLPNEWEKNDVYLFIVFNQLFNQILICLILTFVVLLKTMPL